MTQASEIRVLPPVVDARKLAQQGVELHGIVPAHKLDRLADLASDSSEPVTVVLHFGLDEERHSVVTGKLTGKVKSQCQRCLDDVELAVDCDVNVAIVSGQEQAKALPKRFDPWLVAGGEADLYGLIEEEILLSLPMVAYHPDPCLDQGLYSTGEPEIEESGSDDNPFSVLEQLKGSPNPD